MGEALGDPEHFELAVIVSGLEIEASPAAKVGGFAAQVDGDVPDVAREDTDQLPLGVTELVMKAAEDATSRERLIILGECVGQIKRDEGVGVEYFGEPASGVAMPLWLQNFDVAQRGIT